MIYELAIVIDKGSYWEVTDVSQNTLDDVANKDERILKLSYMAYETIKDALVSGDKKVTIPKTLQSMEVLPGEVNVVDIDTDDITNVRLAQIARVRMLITPALASISSLTSYSWIMLNNELNAKGYFIYDDNREETYLTILETGDDVLIAKLEEYLNHKDEIARVAQLNTKFSNIIKEIMTTETKVSVVARADNFIKEYMKFNS
jgi:hypothetical protein